eukprot:867520-Prorocentrum_minimum.AAC.1
MALAIMALALALAIMALALAIMALALALKALFRRLVFASLRFPISPLPSSPPKLASDRALMLRIFLHLAGARHLGADRGVHMGRRRGGSAAVRGGGVRVCARHPPLRLPARGNFIDAGGCFTDAGGHFTDAGGHFTDARGHFTDARGHLKTRG